MTVTIATTPSGTRMVGYLPPYLRLASVLVSLLDSQASEIETTRNWIMGLIDEMLVSRSTWRLAWWEEELGFSGTTLQEVGNPYNPLILTRNPIGHWRLDDPVVPGNMTAAYGNGFPSFEAIPATGALVSTTGVLSRAAAVAGSVSYLLTATSAGGGPRIQPLVSGITSNTQYTLSWWMRLADPGPAKHMSMNWMFMNYPPTYGQVGSAISGSYTVTQEWQKCVLTGMSPAATVVSCEARLGPAGGVGEGIYSIYTDAWQLETGGAATAFKDDTVALDSTPNHYNGQYVGGVTKNQAGPLALGGGATLFNGTNGHVTMGNWPEFQRYEGTIEAWVKCTAPGTSNRAIFGKSNAWLLILQNSVLGIWNWAAPGAIGFQTTGQNIANGNWHHVVHTFRSGVTNGSVVYLDGVPVLTTTVTVSGQNDPVQAAANTAANFLAGTLAECALYREVLQPHEVRANYDAGLATIRTREMTYAERRSRILGRLQAIAPPTAYNLRTLAASYQYGEIDPMFDKYNWDLLYRFSGILGRPPNIEDLEAELMRVTDAHVSVTFAYTYSLWGEYTQAGVTWAEANAAGLTWGNAGLTDPTTL